MAPFSDFLTRLLANPELLTHLQPREPLLWSLSAQFREMDDATLLGGRSVTDPAHLRLLRGAVWYALDELDTAHRIFQEESSGLGSYWHGMMHRREGDFDNARYWFRRAGRLPVFGRIQEEARGHSATMARQHTWDPYLFTGLCEQVRFGESDLLPECRALQRAEFKALLGYSWEKAVGETAEQGPQ